MGINTVLSLTDKNGTKSIEVDFDIPGSELEEILRESLIRHIPAAKGLEDVIKLSFYVEVPGGGDWSNQRLIIDDENKLSVKLKGTKRID